MQASLYNEADSSMEASDGLNPVSSQGYAEVQSVEARMKLSLHGLMKIQLMVRSVQLMILKT